MLPGLEHLKSDFDLAEYLQSMLITRATGGFGDDTHCEWLRNHFLSNSTLQPLVPRWVHVNRNLDQFWQFIKNEFGTYAFSKLYKNGLPIGTRGDQSRHKHCVRCEKSDIFKI